MQETNSTKSTNQYQSEKQLLVLFMTNCTIFIKKKDSRLRTPSSSHCTIDRGLQRNLLNNLKDKKQTVINGIDPGIKSTATVASVTFHSAFESINKYNILSSVTPEEDHSSLNIGTAEKI